MKKVWKILIIFCCDASMMNSKARTCRALGVACWWRHGWMWLGMRWEVKSEDVRSKMCPLFPALQKICWWRHGWMWLGMRWEVKSEDVRSKMCPLFPALQKIICLCCIKVKFSILTSLTSLILTHTHSSLTLTHSLQSSIQFSKD